MLESNATRRYRHRGPSSERTGRNAWFSALVSTSICCCGEHAMTDRSLGLARGRSKQAENKHAWLAPKVGLVRIDAGSPSGRLLTAGHCFRLSPKISEETMTAAEARRSQEDNPKGIDTKPNENLNIHAHINGCHEIFPRDHSSTTKKCLGRKSLHNNVIRRRGLLTDLGPNVQNTRPASSPRYPVSVVSRTMDRGHIRSIGLIFPLHHATPVAITTAQCH